MEIFIAEPAGTMLLVLLGDGVVANVLLAKMKGQNSGRIVIAAGWGFAVRSSGRSWAARSAPCCTTVCSATCSRRPRP